MLSHLLIVCICGAATVVSVRYLVIPGVECLCTALHLSAKAKGQIIGYATSMPELAVVLAAAWAGVFEAGFWNVASSNIINCVLFTTALVRYRQAHELLHRALRDELTFVVLSVVLPLVMLGVGADVSLWSAGLLAAVFLIYKVLDQRWNAPEPGAPSTAAAANAGRAGLGALTLAAGVAIVIVAGRFLGGSAQVLVDEIGTPAWLVGWALGIITSIPEMTSFWEIYRLSDKRQTLAAVSDTQESLDALVASNMCNLGIILPAGVLVYLLVVA